MREFERKKAQVLIVTLLLSLEFSNSPCLCQTNVSIKASDLVEKMIQAQINYDLVSLDKLEKQLSASQPAAVQLDRQASRDADELRQQIDEVSGYGMDGPIYKLSKEQKLEVLRQYAVALRKGSGICGRLLETDLELGMLDSLKNDCITGLLFSHQPDGRIRPTSTDCWCWLGLAYAVEGDNNKSLACFTIGLRKGGGLALDSCGPLVYHIKPGNERSSTFYPAAYSNFQQAQNEIQAEKNDRLKLKYGG
jgi:hypothetical protein